MTKVTRLTLDEEGGLDRRRIHLREISGDLDTPLETVGQDLRAARLRRGDDLATVSRVLKIRKDHLEALEEDRMEALPGAPTPWASLVRMRLSRIGRGAVRRAPQGGDAGRSDETTPPITVIDEDEHRRCRKAGRSSPAWCCAGALRAYQLPRRPTACSTSRSPAAAATDDAQTRLCARPTKPAPAEPVVVQHPADLSGDTAAPARTDFGSGTSGGADSSQLQSSVYPSLRARRDLWRAEQECAVVLRVRQAARILVEGPDGMVFINRP